MFEGTSEVRGVEGGAGKESHQREVPEEEEPTSKWWYSSPDLLGGVMQPD